MKEMDSFTKIEVKHSNNQKNFMTLVLILKILQHTAAETLKWGVFRPSCSEVLGMLSANSRVEAANEQVFVSLH